MAFSCQIAAEFYHQLIQLFVGNRRFDMIKYMERFGKTSLFTVDALERGNIGRFFNHSCSPNMRTICVFVDTHDFRLPWVSFFTTRSVKAGEVGVTWRNLSHCFYSETIFLKVCFDSCKIVEASFRSSVGIMATLKEQ